MQTLKVRFLELVDFAVALKMEHRRPRLWTSPWNTGPTGRGLAGADEGAWHVNVARERKPVDELTSWAPVVRSFHEPGKYNPVGNPQFPEPITTVKIKLLMPKTHPDTKAELYEIELYE